MKFIFNFIIFLFYFISDSLAYKSSIPRITTPIGTFQGFKSYLDGKEVNAFLGIPYAQPPIGPLRFKKPVAIKKYLGNYKAIHLLPQCPSWKDPRVNLPWISNSTQNEDCLYLNIWSPKSRNNKKLPVLVYSYGYETSSINLEVHDGLALAAIGNVIVVTVSWRTGILGYYYGGNEQAPGNIGGHDQILALQWIQEFIENFGGDPSKVTVFGQGRGAFWLTLFNSISAARGLYSRSIIQSAAPQIIQTREQALTVGKRAAAAAGCLRYSKIDHQCMRNIAVDELLRIHGDILLLTNEDMYPVYDNSFISESLISSFASDNQTFISQSEIITGTNLDEGAILLYHDAPDIFQRGISAELNITTATNVLTRVLDKRLGQIPNDDFLRIMNYYFGNINQTDSKLLESALVAAISATVTCPESFYSALMSTNNNVYRYYFTQDTCYNSFNGWHLSTNFQEVQYVFGMPILNSDLYTNSERQFSIDIIKAWASFAYHG